MGNSQSQEEQPIDTNNYIELKLSNNPFYGEVIVWKDKNSFQTLATANQILNDEERYNQAETQCRKLTKLNHENIIQLLDVQSQQHDEFCSTFFKVALLYEYVEYSLSQDINERKQNQKPYEESELWHIIVSVLAALKYLNFNAINDGDIRPTTVLIDYEGRVKILPRPFFSTKINSYQQYQQEGTIHGVYLSPQLLTNLKQNNLIPNCNISKSDVYTLALSILECINLQPLQNLYDFNNYQINQQVIENILINMNYSKELKSFLQTMLEQDDSKRNDVEDLFQQIEVLCNDNKIKVSDRLYSLKISQDTIQNQIPQQSKKVEKQLFQTPIQQKFSQNKQKESEIVQRHVKSMSSEKKIFSPILQVREKSPQKIEQQIQLLQSPQKTMTVQTPQPAKGQNQQQISSSDLQIPIPKEGTLIQGRYKVLHTEVKTIQGISGQLMNPQIQYNRLAPQVQLRQQHNIAPQRIVPVFQPPYQQMQSRQMTEFKPNYVHSNYINSNNPKLVAQKEISHGEVFKPNPVNYRREF